MRCSRRSARLEWVSLSHLGYYGGDIGATRVFKELTFVSMHVHELLSFSPNSWVRFYGFFMQSEANVLTSYGADLKILVY